jgi:membrane-bound serine protease (ClpP class)
VAFARSIAEKRHRNMDWAAASVRESASITSEEALKTNVVDFLAVDLPDLLKQLSTRTVNGHLLDTAQAEVAEIPMSSWETLSALFLRPEILFLLTLLVIYGFIGELSSPGAVLPGVVGAIALILVLYMSGLVLIGLAVLLFITDTFATTHGVLTTGGIIAFFLGALMLFNHASPGYELSLRWVMAGTLLTAAFFILIVSKGLGAQLRPAQSGVQTMIGRTAPAQSRIDSSGGQVFIEGELWRAVSEVPVESGHPVEITALEGLTLKVKPKS